jgi:tRNA (guanine-N7-)-methyltransferase
MGSGRELFIQSDVLAVITPMVQLIEASGGFDRPAADGRPWRAGNPLAVPTERETYVLSKGLPVYRVLYQRNDRKLPPLPNLEDQLEAVDNRA